jgi:hypothetical protein
MDANCSRCNVSIEVETDPDEIFTRGYYDVRPTDSPAGWDKFANPGETILCDACMWRDPRYIEVFGDMNARSVTPATAEEQAERLNARRLARFSITPDLFLVFTSGWFEVTSNPLPDDARIVSAFYDEPRHCFTVVLQSMAFEPVAQGAAIPDVTPPHLKRIEFMGGEH